MTDIDRLSQFQYNCMAADIETNDVWIGTKAELKRYNSDTYFWERFDASNTGIYWMMRLKISLLGISMSVYSRKME